LTYESAGAAQPVTVVAVEPVAAIVAAVEPAAVFGVALRGVVVELAAEGGRGVAVPVLSVCWLRKLLV